MTDTENGAQTTASLEEIQKGWHELSGRVGQLEAERTALEQENKELRALLARVIEYRQKSHGELVLLLTSLVSKLPIRDVGLIVSKLVEHNAHVSEVCAALAKGKVETHLPQPAVLKALDQTKRELKAALKPEIEELIKLDPPLETEMLRTWIEKPDQFFSPPVIRANRCFLKGQVPRERIVRDFGESAVALFDDMTTDAKLNPHPKPEEILLSFKSDFQSLLPQAAGLSEDQRKGLLELYQKVQRSKAPTDEARAQKAAFLKVSFILELLHFYENQNTEAPDVVFAQRLPALTQQLIINGRQDQLKEESLAEAERLLAFVVNPDHRQAIVNNIGKGGGLGRIVKYVLKLRAEEVPPPDQVVAEFVRRLIPTRQKAPAVGAVTAILQLIKSDMQRFVVRALMDSDRLNKQDAEMLGKAAARQLGMSEQDVAPKARENIPVEVERQMAWERIKEMIAERSDPATIASAIRERLHAKYNADEIKQSWVILIEADPISLIRVFCHLPYLPDGKTDPVARAVMETYVTRLTHEKYASTYHKVLTSLRNMFKANPASPTLVNFLALVKWLDPNAAQKLSADVGMPIAA